MGYFDALTTSSFKTTEDGRRFFFPWGTVGRGYAVASEEEFRRLHGRVKAYFVVSLPLIIGAVAWKGFLGGIALLPILIVPYMIWARAQCRRLTQSDEKLTLGESVRNQAWAHSAVGLWSLEIGSVAFVLVGVLILAFDPRNWVVGLASVTFFGLCALMFARMLIAKRRGVRPGRF